MRACMHPFTRACVWRQQATFTTASCCLVVMMMKIFVVKQSQVLAAGQLDPFLLVELLAATPEARSSFECLDSPGIRSKC